MPPAYYREGIFPPRDLDLGALFPLIGLAIAAVARLDGMLRGHKNPLWLVSLLGRREAVLSSRIEGTQTTLQEALEHQAGARHKVPYRADDAQEVVNYYSAMSHAVQLLKSLPLSRRVILEAHAVLMSGARGRQRSPGKLRRVPNWIGPPGCSQEDATFVPIGAGELPDAFSRWEHYLHSKQPDLLIQAAVMHAEFEALHPFLDGNGRLGRMLIPLFLWQKGLIRQPMLYMSAYFEAHREAYYDQLLAVSRDGDWTGWCQFFLRGVRLQAEADMGRVEAIYDLYERIKEPLSTTIRSRYTLQILDGLFKYPAFTSPFFASEVGIPQRTLRRILGVLRENMILTQVDHPRGRRSALFVFPDLMSILEDETSFDGRG